MNEEFGELVRYHRKKAGKTLNEIARHLGVTKVYVSDVERGQRAPFTAARIEQFADYLDLDATQLHEAAATCRGSVEVDVPKGNPAALQVLSGLARGGISEQTWKKLANVLDDEEDS